MRKVCLVPLFKDYDYLKEPSIISDGWEYYVVSEKEHYSTVWKNLTIELGLHPKLSSGLVLTQPHKFIEADVYCVVGGQIRINTDLNNYEINKDMLFMEHPTRDCIYKEAMACILLRKDFPEVISSQMMHYLNEGLPTGQGMVQTGVTFRKNNEATKRLGTLWFDELKKWSKRDQLSFNYVNWKHKLVEYETMPEVLFRKEFMLHKHN